MPYAQQAALVRLRDPIAYAWASNTPASAIDGTDDAATVLTEAIASATLEVSSVLFRGQRDLAIALCALCIIRRDNPNIGGGQIVSNSDPVSGSVRKASSNLPPGFPAHWYTTPAGEELIGLCYQRSVPSFG